jgi:AcrR family transcriptional regulator
MSRVTDAHVEARRQSILDAAVRVFSTRGVAAATMAEVAEEAGLSAGAIYRYFESKQDLATAAFRECGGQIAEQWRLEVASAADPRQAFYEIARRTFEEMTGPEAADQTRLMLEGYLEATRSGQEAALNAVRFQYAAIVHGLADMVARVQASGGLPAEIDHRALGAALCSFWLGARIFRMLSPETDVMAQLGAVRALMDAAGRGA